MANRKQARRKAAIPAPLPEGTTRVSAPHLIRMKHLADGCKTAVQVAKRLEREAAWWRRLHKRGGWLSEVVQEDYLYYCLPGHDCLWTDGKGWITPCNKCGEG